MAVQFKKRKRTILPLILICSLGITLIITGIYVSKKLAKYQYENSISEYELPKITSPTKTSVEITYFKKAPKSVKIQRKEHNDKTFNDTYEITADTKYDKKNKKIYLSYDVKNTEWDYVLQVKPSDNKEVQVYIKQSKSEKYVNADITSEKINGDTVITLKNFDSELTMHVDGYVSDANESFSKTIKSAEIKPNTLMTIKLSDYIKKYKKANQLQLSISDDDDKTENINKSFMWDNTEDEE